MMQVIVTPLSESAAHSAPVAQKDASPAATIEWEQLTVHVNTVIVSATAARRAVNSWLTWDVGEHLVAGLPELLLGERLLWRVPVKWTSSQNGVLSDRVCDVLVDAITGGVLDKDAKLQDIQRNVERAARAFQTTIT